jgi:hypothetical protein
MWRLPACCSEAVKRPRFQYCSQPQARTLMVVCWRKRRTRLRNLHRMHHPMCRACWWSRRRELLLLTSTTAQRRSLVVRACWCYQKRMSVGMVGQKPKFLVGFDQRSWIQTLILRSPQNLSLQNQKPRCHYQIQTRNLSWLQMHRNPYPWTVEAARMRLWWLGWSTESKRWWQPCGCQSCSWLVCTRLSGWRTRSRRLGQRRPLYLLQISSKLGPCVERFAQEGERYGER